MYEKYLDAKLTPEERAEDLLSKMSVEEKMGQINCLIPWHNSENYDKKGSSHGIGQISTLIVREFDTIEELVEWQRKYQNLVMEQSEHHIPAVFHMEGLCGAFIQGAESFPSGIARGASFDTELEKEIGEAVARQELCCGINQILAPVLDVSRDPRMGREGESYGEDAALVSAMGTAYVKGAQGCEIDGRKAESEGKHFLGFHTSMGGIHGANVEMGERKLKEVFAKPFQAAITDASLRGIMPCYCSINGIPVSSSKEILTGLLRNEMGFDGVTASDYGAIHGVYSTQHSAESRTDAGMMCLEAGLDVEQQSSICYNDEMKELFKSGKADIKILDTAVLRILTAKFRMGLFENPYALSGEELKKQFAVDKDITMRSALESIVLIKNDGVLPLKKGIKKIAVIGSHADNARMFFGGYTHISMEEAVYAAANSLAGISQESKKTEFKTVPGTQIQSDEAEEFNAILKHRKPDCKSLLEQLREDLPECEVVYSYGYSIAGNDVSGIEEALKVCEGADAIIMTLGGKHGSGSVASMGEGVDAVNINLPYCQDAFIERASKLGIPMIGVHFNGRPVSSDIADKYLNAIVEAWNPSEMGAPAISKILRGEYNPSGKMPVTTLRSSGQVSLYYCHDYGSAWHQGDSVGFKDYVDMPHTPRYCFGHGLSYTEFEYSGLEITSKEDKAEISFTLKNTGKYAGTEIVQLYFSDQYASLTRPVKELAGFGRVNLEPGESKKITFTMKYSQTAFLDREMKWKIEKGGFDILVGSSSEDIRLKGTLNIAESSYIDGAKRGFYADFTVS